MHGGSLRDQRPVGRRDMLGLSVELVPVEGLNGYYCDGRNAVNADELQRVMDKFDLFDNALLFHSYTEYMRDYALIVEIHIGPAEQGIYSYLFKYCVETHVHTSVQDEVYIKSLDERLIDYNIGKDLDSYVWGVNWSILYPGWTLKTLSKNADDWSKRLGLDFHEVEIVSNAFSISLILSALDVQKLSDRIDSGIERAYWRLK